MGLSRRTKRIIGEKMAKIWKKPISAEELNTRLRVKIMDFVDYRFDEIGDDFVSASIVVDERTHQPYGVLHGGAICLLAENIGSIAAYYCTEKENDFAFGMNLNASYFRPTFTGRAKAIARPKHIGKSTQVWDIEVLDDESRLISKIMFTVAVRRNDNPNNYPTIQKELK